jgi:hypothetical protein
MDRNPYDAPERSPRTSSVLSPDHIAGTFPLQFLPDQAARAANALIAQVFSTQTYFSCIRNSNSRQAINPLLPCDIFITVNKYSICELFSCHQNSKVEYTKQLSRTGRAALKILVLLRGAPSG